MPYAFTGSKQAQGPPVVLPGGAVIDDHQKGNPVLECIRNVGRELGDIVADYQVGKTTGVLFLSLKYHRLHPEYIHMRIEKLALSYTLRILLILCDITEHKDPIKEITKTCLINNITVIVAFSNDEAGHYLSTFKQFEHKPPDIIKERVAKDYDSVLRTALTSVSKVNKTDVETLRTTFGSFANIAKATPEQLQNLPGFGQVKVKNIKNAFEKPLRNQATNTLVQVASTAPEASNPSSAAVRADQGADSQRSQSNRGDFPISRQGSTNHCDNNQSEEDIFDFDLDP
ncbi:hypothetical protein AX16_000745 [Volvariella volvacea WC 439]|nr:hypothetical protein AX16_000745 [Volvariella volvacea WC 439]